MLNESAAGNFTGSFSGTIGPITRQSLVPIIKSGLKLYYDAGIKKSYPRFGNVWKDLSGNGLNAALINNPAYSIRLGGSIVLNGSSNYAVLPANYINTNANFTINIISTPVVISSSIVLFNNGSNGGFVIGYEVYRLSIGVHNVLGFGSFPILPVSFEVPFLLSITFNKQENTFKCFVNGRFLGSITIASTTFVVTASAVLGFNNTNSYYQGNLYHFSYYDRILGDAEILQSFMRIKGRLRI